MPVCIRVRFGQTDPRCALALTLWIGVAAALLAPRISKELDADG
jgi:hypothetical protein